ncbi:MAG TPA: 3-hydroxyacyl-CoA dehydrogenase NAD-binding domain-containing protein, partial [Syntrophobacteraceae bacterium]|nr:3-hydroxyacyl-CoA dehydrogenase NAD-binding domain-containing protein [Syntrophobacteraceae bacterium]
MSEPVTLFCNRFFESPLGRIAIVTMDNGVDYKRPNTFSEAALLSLGKTLDEISRERDVRGLMLTGKPYAFAAGADLTEVPFITTFEQGYQVGRIGHMTMKRIMDLPFPTLAAINGVAVGGGLEIALYCGYRTVHRSVQPIGFPECFLGLVPGWGGCALATRLLGPAKALELIIYNALNRNRMISGPMAFDLGLADRLFDGAEFLDESLQFLLDIISGKAAVDRGPMKRDGLKDLIDQAKAFVDDRVHGATPAPYRALDLIAGACEWDLETAFEEENKALGDLIKSRQCKASMYSFDLVNRHARKTLPISQEVKPGAINRVGIIGAGLMASQLAQLFIRRLEVPVVMKDISREVVDKGCAYVRQELRRLEEKGRVSKGKSRYLAGLLKGTLDYGEIEECDFVIEAVFERIELKQQVLGEVEQHLRPDAVIASNTSSLSITTMTKALKAPERMIGFHFFNPVAVMPLIEIVRSEKTSAQTLATAFDLSARLKKTGILVKDSPAFLVNRTLVRVLVDCLSLVDEGAGFEQVEEALLALGLPTAPFELLDLVGLPVALHVMETLNQAFGRDRFPLNASLQTMIEANKAAFYLRDGKTIRIDPELEKLWVRSGKRHFHPEEIQERV